MFTVLLLLPNTDSLHRIKLKIMSENEYCLLNLTKVNDILSALKWET